MKYKARNLVHTFLKEQGITARESKIGTNFDYDNWNFLLWHDADDPLFFRLTLPGIYDITDENYARALMACNNINWNYKVVKASLYEFEEAGKQRSSVWVCYEQQLDATAKHDGLVAQAITALLDAAEQFQSLVDD